MLLIVSRLKDTRTPLKWFEEGVREIRTSVLASVIAIAVAVMMAVPVSAGAKTVYVTDRQGDLGKPWYGADMTPPSYWSGDSPVSHAGYLDIRAGWVTVKGDTVTMGMKVDNPLTSDSVLPEGIKVVRWLWFFYRATDYFFTDYVVAVQWDGVQFKAWFAYGEAAPTPFITEIDTFSVVGDTISATISGGLMPDAKYWFFESQVWMSPPLIPGEWRVGGWFAVDVTDEPTNTYLPWWPMP